MICSSAAGHLQCLSRVRIPTASLPILAGHGHMDRRNPKSRTDSLDQRSTRWQANRALRVRQHIFSQSQHLRWLPRHGRLTEAAHRPLDVMILTESSLAGHRYRGHRAGGLLYIIEGGSDRKSPVACSQLAFFAERLYFSLAVFLSNHPPSCVSRRALLA